MPFIQTLTFRSFHEQQVHKLLEEWVAQEADRAPGFERARLLKDRDREDTYAILVEFSSHEEAMRNSERPETARWAERLWHAAEGDVSYRDWDVL